MRKWFEVIIPLGLALTASQIMTVAHWEKVDQGLLFAFSILAGAALVRSARGLPISYNDFLEAREAEAINFAFKKVTRKLIYLTFVFVTNIFIIIFSPALFILAEKMNNILEPSFDVKNILIFLVVFISGYSVSVGIQLLRIDYDLVVLQGDILEKAVTRRYAKEREQKISDAEKDKPFKTPPGYGKLLDR